MLFIVCRTLVQVIHFDFENLGEEWGSEEKRNEIRRTCDATDVVNLRATFNSDRNCTLIDLKSPSRDKALNSLTSEGIKKHLPGESRCIEKGRDDKLKIAIFFRRHEGAYSLHFDHFVTWRKGWHCIN